MFQAKHSGKPFAAGPDKMIHNQNVNIPPATHLIGDLEPHSLYAVRVACHSSQGPSDWSPWVDLRTKEGGEASKWGDVCFHPECVHQVTSSEGSQGRSCVIWLLMESKSPPSAAVYCNQSGADDTLLLAGTAEPLLRVFWSVPRIILLNYEV